MQAPKYSADELAVAFLRKLLPTKGFYVMQFKMRSGAWSEPHFASTVEELWDLIQQRDRDGLDAYHACASYKVARTNPRKVQSDEQTIYSTFFPEEKVSALRIYGRTKANVYSVKAFWRDIDVGQNKHYKTRGEADKAVIELCNKNNLPLPIFVNSGHGLHIYWILTEELDLTTWDKCNRELTRLCQEIDLHCERVDITSMLRTPSTHNHKDKKSPLPVEINPKFLDHPPCTLKQLAAFTSGGDSKSATAEVTKLRLLDGADAKTSSRSHDYPISYAAHIVTRCGQLQHMRNQKGNIAEPAWYADLGVLAYCADGEKHALEWSKGHPDFTEEETLKKLEQWRNAVSGPATCAKLNTDNPGICERCAFWKRIKTPIVLGATPDDIAELNQNHFMIRNIGNKCRIGTLIDDPRGGTGKILSLLPPNDFKIFYSNRAYSGNRKKKLGAAWVEHSLRRQYDGVDLVPHAPEELPNGKFNLWQGFAIKPKRGDWSRMRWHIKNIWANGIEAAANYALNWIAWLFQHPDERAEAVLIVIGEEGAGKSFVVECLLYIFGAHGVKVSSARELTGNFNAHIGRRLLVGAEEAYWPGNKEPEGKFKEMISGRTIRVEFKGVDVVDWPNRLHIIMTANPSWVVPASHNARRFSILQCSNRYAKKSNMSVEQQKEREEYFSALIYEMEHGGREAMLHDLLKCDLKGWHPRQIYEGKGLQKQKALSLPALAKWMELLLQEGKLPGQGHEKLGFVPTDKLMEDVLKHISRHDAYFIGEEKLADYLREDWCKGLMLKYRMPDGGARGWIFASLADMRAAWERHYGPWQWDHPDLKDWDGRQPSWDIAPLPFTPRVVK
jgi:hypothetical protein